MTPLQIYESSVQSGQIVGDLEQRKAVLALQQIYDQLEKKSSRFGWFKSKKTGIAKGLYLWGGVGRGKTWMMDQFHDCVQNRSKIRIHFHRFMQSMHDELKQNRDISDPLAKIGKQFARKYPLICLDEFLVKDIGDAMILAGLLKALFEQGTTMVMTSNTEPDNLYQDGLQRASFLPAIELIKAHTDVHFIGNGVDYRLRALSGHQLYYSPLGEETRKLMESEYQMLSCDDCEDTDRSITVMNREISTIRRTRNLIWLDFWQICDGPRASADYIEIANCYRTVMISNVPILTWEYENQARRFIELVDEFYDHGVHLVLSAEAEPDDLYTGKRLVQDYQRTASRLKEMQTEHYLSKTHGI